MPDRIWTIYVCHACGWVQGEEEDNLACARCGEPRSMIEAVEVKEMPDEG
jgi:rRNA maturation endonuclease Nob1